MTDKELTEFSQWIWKDTARLLAHALLIYTSLMTTYWLTIG